MQKRVVSIFVLKAKDKIMLKTQEAIKNQRRKHENSQ